MPEKKIPLYELDHFLGKLHSGLFIMPMHLSEKELKQFEDLAAVPHRHDHYCCFFIEEGKMELKVDFKPVTADKSTLLISYPGQVHQTISAKKCKGWMLVFDAKLVDENARMIIEESLTKIALLKLDTKENDWFKKLFELLLSVVNSEHSNTFQTRLLRSLLDSFIFKATELYQAEETSRMQDYSSRTISITKKFRQLLQKNFRHMKKPSEYAEKMNFSTSHLNDTIKAVTGFPVSYFIQQEVIGEAQRLLYYTEMSIKEIAYDLGYDDDKYFIRLFGKQTGISPTNFRKRKTASK